MHQRGRRKHRDRVGGGEKPKRWNIEIVVQPQVPGDVIENIGADHDEQVLVPPGAERERNAEKSHDGCDAERHVRLWDDGERQHAEDDMQPRKRLDCGRPGKVEIYADADREQRECRPRRVNPLQSEAG